MVAVDYQPYSIVEDQGFRSLIEELEPRYDMPSLTISSCSVLPKIYKKEEQKLSFEIITDSRQRLETSVLLH
jgi:hypothetical protein